MGFWENEARISARAGFILPFVILALGVRGLFVMHFDTSHLTELCGIVQKYHVKDGDLFIYLQEYKKPYIVAPSDYIQKITPKLDAGRPIHIWFDEKSSLIWQAAIDGSIIFYYSYQNTLIFYLSLIGLGLVIIPFVIKARIKDAKYFGDENIIFRKQWRKPFSEDR